jgi:hypothetical protein
MLKTFLLLVSTIFLLAATALGQEDQTQPARTPAEAQPPQPEKKPDAFQYFFGRKEKKEKQEPEKAKAAEAPAEPAAPVEPAPTEQPGEPAAATAPIPVAPAPEAAPAKTQAEPQVDAFQYFFGRGSQPVPTEDSRKDPPERKPVDVFDYFFGKDGKADSPEEKPKSPPPV